VGWWSVVSSCECAGATIATSCHRHRHRWQQRCGDLLAAKKLRLVTVRGDASVKRVGVGRAGKGSGTGSTASAPFSASDHQPHGEGLARLQDPLGLWDSSVCSPGILIWGLVSV
jgi:hypothetical protein